ncbi:serine hydrolase [Algoriphagus halophytocola]|uniref:Class A beta-lactamase-related serine hydrolase n=1 Tax=Algoriphagus halophytocola TaxID=2991499 RepID=A0ABY6MFB4_9BACT|nr:MULTISPECIES: class A beta-lactamase-related serine hydrolase [unclassified Algoriphagus]UZD21644.1 class A beta-lactamase-related serine hydrolase [Algoriphagus sp. TR-M5]WBL42856.1 serine hydrolase [Algoriphagus sp. TR-M9]
MIRSILCLLFVTVFILSCSNRSDIPFEGNLDEYPTLKRVLDSADKYKVQLIYTQIDRNEHGNPLFTDYTVNLEDQRYFYPASTVKLPVALLSLEWLEEQSVAGLTEETTMLIDSVRPSQVPALSDFTAEDSLPSIAQYIKKILLVSDNDAYNRLYELLGQDYINEKLKEKGLQHTMINHRLSFPISAEENRYFNPVKFVDSSGNVLLELPERHAEREYALESQPSLGIAHYAGEKLVEAPMDFTFKNKFALSDLHGVVQRIVFPGAFMESQRFQLNEEHRDMILKYMSMYPGESDFPKYELPEYYDSYSKFFKFGSDQKPIPEQFRIFNKTGWAYGHLIDGSYFVDFESGVEFFVSAVIYVNENETLNDNEYEFEEIGTPFFTELGEYLYNLELKRKRMISPDLSQFRFDYAGD